MRDNERKPKLTVGDKFILGRVTCDITKLDYFSGTQHYGFTWATEDRCGCGWIPCEIADSIAAVPQPLVRMQNSKTGLFYVLGSGFSGTITQATILYPSQAAVVKATFQNCIEIPA